MATYKNDICTTYPNTTDTTADRLRALADAIDAIDAAEAHLGLIEIDGGISTEERDVRIGRQVAIIRTMYAHAATMCKWTMKFDNVDLSRWVDYYEFMAEL